MSKRNKGRRKDNYTKSTEKNGTDVKQSKRRGKSKPKINSGILMLIMAFIFLILGYPVFCSKGMGNENKTICQPSEITRFFDEIISIGGVTQNDVGGDLEISLLTMTLKNLVDYDAKINECIISYANQYDIILFREVPRNSLESMNSICSNLIDKTCIQSSESNQMRYFIASGGIELMQPMDLNEAKWGDYFLHPPFSARFRQGKYRFQLTSSAFLENNSKAFSDVFEDNPWFGDNLAILDFGENNVVDVVGWKILGKNPKNNGGDTVFLSSKKNTQLNITSPPKNLDICSPHISADELRFQFNN